MAALQVVKGRWGGEPARLAELGEEGFPALVRAAVQGVLKEGAIAAFPSLLVRGSGITSRLLLVQSDHRIKAGIIPVNAAEVKVGQVAGANLSASKGLEQGAGGGEGIDVHAVLRPRCRRSISQASVGGRPSSSDRGA